MSVADGARTAEHRDAGSEAKRALIATLLGILMGTLAAVFARREERE